MLIRLLEDGVGSRAKLISLICENAFLYDSNAFASL